MHIYINARFLTHSISGVERYATELIKEIDTLIDIGKIDKQKFSFEMLAPKNIKYDLDLKHIPLKKVGYFSGHLWEQVELPFYSRNGFLLSLCTVSTLFKLNQIVTIHDAAFAANSVNFKWIFSTWYKLLAISLGKIAKRVITVSNFSKKELNYYCNIPYEKLSVIYEGNEHIKRITPDYSVLSSNELESGSFILAVSNINPNKNFNSIAKAIELLNSKNLTFVVAGGHRPQAFKQIEPLASERVKCVGYVSDEELKALYEHAACFVYPSFYEGFGLPPLEAISCGCPVVISKTSALPEIFDNAVLYCDPYSPDDIANQINKLISDQTLREELKKRGLERAEQFSWRNCAWGTLNIINEVLDLDEIRLESKKNNSTEQE